MHDPLHAIHAELAALRREVAGLRADLARHGLAGDDHAELIEAVHRVVGARSFLAIELLAGALRRDADGERLAALVAGKSPRAIGKLLSAVAGKHTSCGLTLHRDGACAAGSIWSVRREFETRQTHLVA